MTTSPLDRLRSIAQGAGTLPSVSSGLGVVLDEVDPGRVVARLPVLPPPAFGGPGPLLVLADLALSAAITTMLPAGRAVSTLTMHASGLGSRPRAGGTLVAVGGLVHLADDNAVSSAEIRDGDGGQVALLTCRCAVLPVRSGGSWDGARPDPSRNPLAALAPSGPVGELRAVAAPAAANTSGGVQGGALAALAAHAMEQVVGDVRPHLVDGVAELDITFLRGVPADGSAVAVSAEVVRAGSRFGSARAEVRDASGRLAAVASSAHWRGAGAD